MRPVLGRVSGALLLALVALIMILPLFAPEPRSAFSSSASSPLVADAKTLDYELRRVVATPSQLGTSHPEEAAMVLVDAPTAFTGSEVDAVRDFVQAGGALLVVDVHGYGTQLTSLAGLSYERVRLVEPTGFLDARLQGRTFQLSAANATAIKLAPDSPARVVVGSSNRSYIDRDGDGAIGQSDPPGPFPVLASAPVGRGRVWALSAPSVFAGGEDAGHAAFRLALLTEVMGSRSVLLVEESRVPDKDPTVSLARFLLRTDRTGAWEMVIAGSAALGIAAVLARGKAPWGPHSFNPRRFLQRKRAARSMAPQQASGWTRRGAVAACVAAVLGGMGLSTGNPQATWAAAFLVAALASALTMHAPTGFGLREVSHRTIQETSTLTVRTTAQLRHRGSGVEVRDHLDDDIEVVKGQAWAVPIGRAATLEYALRPSRLGLYNVGPLSVQRQDALGLRVLRRSLLSSSEVRVTPRTESLRATPFHSRVPRIIMGVHAVQRAGAGSEFLSMRPYQPGDPERAVNWRASARSRELIVNQRIHESMTDLTVLLDVRELSDVGPAAATPFVLGARAAASITRAATRSRDRVRVVLYGDGLRRIDGRGSDQQQRFEEELAATRPRGGATVQEAVTSVQAELRPGRPVVVISGGEEDSTLLGTLLSLRQRGLRPFLLSPKVWTGTDANEEERRVVERRDEALMTLRSKGIPVYETSEGLLLDHLFRIQGVPK